ncbi:hypothetical protein AB4Z21_09670 [Paenibacillus sp. MCAF20]
MANVQSRQREIVCQLASRAWNEPLLGSGLWRHDDIRNNVYDASYLAVASSDSVCSDKLGIDRREAMAKAASVLERVLELQDKNRASDTFGHWPLGLGDRPDEARPNLLPAELMGVLIVYFQQQYGAHLPETLNQSLNEAIEALYQSTYYRVPLKAFNHHEAKYTATKLIFGSRFKDEELLEKGRLDLQQILDRVRTLGLPEYGALPWFWHWIQAFTCAYEIVAVHDIREDLASLLNELWNYRATYYLKGAWTGGRMRSLGHDLPRDGNVAFDYVQFGDFSLPQALTRVEYAGLLFYPAPESAIRTAMNRDLPQIIERVIAPAGEEVKRPLHSYLYVDKGFAMGGIRERVKEYDNEQHRWGIDFPLRQDGGVNRLYIMQPGEGCNDGDLRHAGESGQLLFHRNAIIALFPFAEGEDGRLVGVLPKGEWMRRHHSLFGRIDDVYIALYLLHDFTLVEEVDRIMLTSRGLAAGGVVVEAVSADTAARKQLNSLKDFMSEMVNHNPLWSVSLHESLRVEYANLDGEMLALALHEEPQRTRRSMNDTGESEGDVN